MEENITLENVQVDNQGRLTGKVKDTGGEESRAFSQLFQRIQNHFNDEQMVSVIPHNVRQKDLCIGKSSKDKKWHRVSVESVLSTGQGFQASCFFVDNGTFEMIPLAFLRQIPDPYREIPFQLKKLYLYGVTPITLTISPEDLMTSLRPCYKWDTSAVDFIKKNINLAEEYKAVVMEQRSDGALGIRLYLKIGETRFCLNERLVSKKYATTMTEDDNDASVEPAVSAKPKRTIADVLKSKKIKLKQPAQSDTEEQTCVSEPELQFGMLQASSGSDRERGYTTDSLLIPHRHRPSRMALSAQKDHSETMEENRNKKETDTSCHKDISSSQEKTGNVSVNKPQHSKKGILDKLEASLIASSGRSSPLSDVQSQDNYLVYDRQQSAKGSQSSLSRLKISSTTVTSYCQTGSDSENSEFSTDAQSDIPKFQTVSQISPHTLYQSGPKHDTAFIKGHQSDTSHCHIKPDSTKKQAFSPQMCSDTENDRYKIDKSRFQSDRQECLVYNSLSPASSSQGSKADHEEVKTDSPLSSLLKHFSDSNSSLGSGSPVRGRGISSLEKGQGIGSPGRGQWIGSPGRGKGIGSPIGGRGLSLSSSPTKPGLPIETDGYASENVHCKQSCVNIPESPIPAETVSGKPHLSCSGVQGFHFSTFDNKTRFADELRSQESEHTTMDKRSEKTCKISIFDKISNACAKSPMPGPIDLEMTDSHLRREKTLTQKITTAHESVLPKSTSSHLNTRELQTESFLTAEHNTSQGLLNRFDKLLSDNENAVWNNVQIRTQRPTAYSSGTESDSLLAKLVTGQQVYTKARLPREATQNTQKSPEKSFKTIPHESASVSEQETKIQRTQKMSKTIETDSELARPSKRLTVTEKEDRTETREEQKQKLFAKLAGQRMLKDLKESSGRLSTSPQEKQDKARSKSMFGIEDNVLVHGNQPKKPIYRFSDARFAEIISQYWMLRDFPSPQIIQAYAWPAIRQGKHVVAIAPQGTGKTLAYLCPLITSLTDQRLYKGIGVGNGPYLFILTSSWRKADAVFSEARNILGGRTDLRLILLHGGGQEENKGCQLINGCEILVVTPPSLKRVLDAGYTDLQRLCHLVIDDAEEIMENFGEEIKFIMREYAEVISNQSSRTEVPRQILLFGTQWTGRLHSFMNRYPVEPLLIITSAFEASIYGRVKQITHMCKDDNRMREVTGVLENLTEADRTIIFASKKEDIINVHKIVRNYSIFCLMVHSDMEMYEINRVAEEWRHHRLNLLVCCDEHVSEMHISDASTIINYDLPDSKTKFCNRLACLRKYFRDFSSDQEPTVKPVSHLILTERVQGSQVYSIFQLLKRSNSPIPQELKALMAGAKRGKEEDDMNELCSQLLAFGFCRNQWKCPFRHIVFPELDHPEELDWLPDEGEVQVFVTNVIDASHYYARLISMRYGDVKEDLGTAYSELQMDMGLWYGNPANHTRHKSPFEGEICGYQDRENFYRVQILNFKDMNCRGAVNIDVTVKFVDSGRVNEIPAHKLYELPAHLREVPFQAVEVFVCRVKPIDRDTAWTYKADTFIHSLLHSKIVEGKIVLRLGSILWLDPLVERQNLGETKTIINKTYVHRELITNGFAEENPNHLEKLYKLCEDKVKIPKALIKKAKVDYKLETDVLPECKQYHSVVVSSVAKPDLFFIQRKEKLDELDELMDTVSNMMTSQDPVEDVGVEVKVGDYCLAEYTSYDKRWYRGRVTRLEEDTCEVFFADYGDRDTVPRDKVRKIPNDDKLTDLPLQGIECRLADIVPRDNHWGDKAGDVMWDLTHFVNGDMKTFTAKVKSKDKPDYAGRYRYVIELYNTSESQDFSLAQELVWQGLGVPGDEESGLTELFDRPSKLRMLIVRTPLQDVPDLCSAIYWEKDEVTAVKIAGEIKSKLEKTLSSSLIKVEDSVKKSAIASVVKLVGRVESTDVNRMVLDTILVLTKSGESISKELLQEDCDQQIIRCLELNSDGEVQFDTADTLSKLIQVSASWKSCFEDLQYVEVLYDLFDSTESQQIQGLVCKAFSILCTNTEVFNYIMRKGICSTLTKLLTQSSDHNVIETVVLFLLAGGHPDLERESLLQAIILSLKKANCEKCIYHCVQFCSNFGSQKRRHKTVLLELEMVPCLSRILQSDLSPETRRICEDLRDSLAIKVPSQKMSGLHARSLGETPTQSTVVPEILWAQNSFNVMLTVKVKNATNSSDLVKIQDDMVNFRAVVDGVCFAFIYKLFDKVMFDHTRVRVRSSEVHISMKKVEKGRWPRLLHQKQKPANLSIDFERFVDSSDEEFCDEHEPFMLKRKKKTKVFTDAPKTKIGPLEPEEDLGTDTTDSLENMEDPDMRDRFNFLD